MKFHPVAIFLLLSFTKAYSQQEYLTNRTDFKEGIYFTYKDFANNKPSLRLDQVNFERKEGGIPTQRYLYNFKLSPDVQLDPDTLEVWGVCLNGFPYINQSSLYSSYESDSRLKVYPFVELHAYRYTRIMMIGHICHFTAEGAPTPNGLYPASLQKEAYLKYKHNGVGVQYLLKASTGEICLFSRRNLLKLIEDDAELYQKYSSMSSRRKKKEIFNILREYNSKHQLMIQ